MSTETEISEEYKEKPLDYLLDQWEAGNLNDEQKKFVIAKIPVMEYVERNES